MVLGVNEIISLNGINRLILIIHKCGLLFEVWTGWVSYDSQCKQR